MKTKMKHFLIGFLAFSIGIFVGLVTYDLLMHNSESESFHWSVVMTKNAIVSVCVGFVLSLINIVSGVLKFGEKQNK